MIILRLDDLEIKGEKNTYCAQPTGFVKRPLQKYLFILQL